MDAMRVIASRAHLPVTSLARLLQATGIEHKFLPRCSRSLQGLAGAKLVQVIVNISKHMDGRAILLVFQASLLLLESNPMNSQETTHRPDRS